MPYFSEALNEPVFEPGFPSSSLSPVLQDALTVLENGDFYARWEAAKQISTSSVEAAQQGDLPIVVASLLNLLQEDDSEELSWYVARILGTLNDPLAVSGLLHLIQTTQSTDVAGMAATALANCGAAAIPPLVDLLHQPQTKLLAMRALAQIRHSDVIQPLLALTADPMPIIRSTAIDALSRFPHLDENFFLAALQDADSSVRRSAVSALGVLAQSLDKADATRRDDFAAALQPLLWDIDLEVCCQAALTLGRIGNASAISQLYEVLRSPNTPALLQQTIIRALGWSQTPEAIESLQQVLCSNSAVLPEASQIEIITVLGRLQEPVSLQAAIQILLDLLQTQHPICQTSKGKQTIAHSLGQLAASAKNITFTHQAIREDQVDAVIDALIYLLNNSDSIVRLHTIAALKAFDNHSVDTKLISLMQNELISTNLREGVAVALAERKRSIK